MHAPRIFGTCVPAGAFTIAALAAGSTFLALLMGAALGAAVAVMILAFPLDLGRREMPRVNATRTAR